ncbi:GNAT family N-acetyltransferase [Romboutsia maritimum]|uniref:GNAT family N-acetyltransferase n=1 Tax=Romboutsia maritimum TaxID=2020948 RepID=A0A371IQ94_9FIRM|nr:GNAT family N-acetyltransferase [Romboutsia maritimum]RDY22646.1 GNAT family N-acetyltransferase [Romboutsia maritimum]
MQIRIYNKLNDFNEIIELFYNTVHNVNSKDYNKEQLNAWAPKNIDKPRWFRTLSEHYSIVAELDGTIIGFGDIDSNGYLDRLFVHKDYQGIKVATHLVKNLEQYAINNGVEIISTEASITARPFFEKQGYKVIEQQRVEIRGQNLTNFKMIKSL